MKRLGILALVAGGVLAQTGAPEKKLEFEVASIRKAVDDGDHDTDSDRGSFRSHNVTLKRLIAQAWDIDASEVLGGPNWIDSDGFDINAKVPEELAKRTRQQDGLMIQNLLMDRFKLVIHREQHQVAGYRLVVAAKGIKMKPAKESESGSEINSSRSHVTARYVTMEGIARYLSRNRDIGKLVVDGTGLKERFDFELDWQPEQNRADADSDDKPPLVTALQEQLGVRLVPANVAADMVVVDRAEHPDSN
jgi:uncharacterized protein (TIGR03435 family)